MRQNPFIENAKTLARKNPQMIVFPEAELDTRIIEAANKISKQKLAYVILLGNKEKITTDLKNYSRKISNFIQIHDFHENTAQRKFYADQLLKTHGENATEEEIQKLLDDINYYGVMMVKHDHAHAMISGTTFPTADTVRPALKIIGTKEKFHKVSGFFFMLFDNRILLFADCAINIRPDSHDLMDIAIDTAETAKKFGLDPRVAFLSFSTNGSADHPEVDKIREAVKLARDKAPNILMEGEMQVDTALVPRIAKRKWSESQLGGTANILIFPDLAAANIAYKLVERLAGAKAVGPILQGLNKPVNDLSRGCSVEDIVNMAAITSIEAQDIPYF